ncbi:Scn11a [Symbiodinium natans]|uniref:Scn11a protein n=1 Tax=Symbiodinium natans TaxID=878477 RepID=A0A812RWD4_9DINO|nr:Scn11a [Symbiodinium natans]
MELVQLARQLALALLSLAVAVAKAELQSFPAFPSFDMSEFCRKTPLPFLCPKEFAAQHPQPPSCSQVPDRCCLQSSCIMMGPYFLPGIGECRPDRGRTTCADLSTPFGGTGVCQCVEGVCASNGVCMGGGSFFGHLPFSSLYKDGDRLVDLVVPPEDHSALWMTLGVACVLLALAVLRPMATPAVASDSTVEERDGVGWNSPASLETLRSSGLRKTDADDWFRRFWGGSKQVPGGQVRRGAALPTADDTSTSMEHALKERLLQLHHDLRRALDENWLKLIDSLEDDILQVQGDGRDGKLASWIHAEVDADPGHPGTASRASNPTEYCDKDSVELDADEEDDAQEMEIRDIERDLQEPTGTSFQKFCRYSRAKLARAERRILDLGVGILISLNTLVMMLAHQQMGYDAARDLGEYDPAMDSLSISEDVFVSIEEAFAVIFLLELIVRLWIHRLHYFRSAFNVFDAFLVALSLVDMLIIKQLEGSGRVNMVVLRILRILKLTRSLRVMRTMRLFTGLRVLVAAVSAFLPSLFWSMLFLTIYMVLGGLLIGNFVMEFITDAGQDLEIRKWIWQHYGTSYRATYTMFQVTFAGCWPSYVNPLYENVSQWYSAFFCAYVTFVVFAVMRVITAIFIKETLDAAGEDHEVVMSEKEATKQKYMRKLARVFHEVDTSGDGLISEDEFRSMMEDPNVKRFLAGLEVDLNESHSLFHMLADEEGQVSYTKFMEGMMRAHGPAKSADVLCIRQDLEFIRKDIKLIKALKGFHSSAQLNAPGCSVSNICTF